MDECESYYLADLPRYRRKAQRLRAIGYLPKNVVDPS